VDHNASLGNGQKKPASAASELKHAPMESFEEVAVEVHVVCARGEPVVVPFSYESSVMLIVNLAFLDSVMSSVGRGQPA
jgi:hypothetical protein